MQETLVQFLGRKDPQRNPLQYSWASLVAQIVKNMPAMQETLVQSLGQEDPLEKEMATHSSILAWRSPMDRGGWQATVHAVATRWTKLKRLSTHASTLTRLWLHP